MIMVPEIWGARERIFCHSGWLFALLPPYRLRKSKFWKNEHHNWRYYHFTNEYHKWQSYNVWFLRYEVQQTEFLVILDHFLYSPLPKKKKKNQNFEKLKKPTEDIIILHIHTINDNHMMYSSWGMKLDRHNFVSFCTIFLPFYHPNKPKNQSFEKMKKKS